MNSKNDISLHSKYSQMNLDALKDLNLNGQTKIVLDSRFIQFKSLNRNQMESKLNENYEMQSQVRLKMFLKKINI